MKQKFKTRKISFDLKVVLWGVLSLILSQVGRERSAFASELPTFRFTSIGSIEDTDSYHAFVNGMPDLDQRREDGTYLGRSVRGLPGGGENHCAQAATANVLGWISNTGYLDASETVLPDLAPRSNEWRPPAASASDAVKRAYIPIYNAQTDFINELGVEMGVRPAGVSTGTEPESLVESLSERLPYGFGVSHFSDYRCTYSMREDGSGTYDPDLGMGKLYRQIARGNLVLMHTADYQEGPSAVGGKVWDYIGGTAHVAVVTDVILPKSPHLKGTIFTSDSADRVPVSGAMALTQGSFLTTSLLDVPQSEELVNYTGESACGFYGKKATVIRWASDPTRATIITGITVISPPGGSPFVGYRPTEVRTD